MKKFWMVRNGQVGTAHRNREGAMVDFRHVEKPAKLKKVSNGIHIVLEPPKGVEIEPLCLPATLESRQVLEDTVCHSTSREAWSASFEGVEFSVRHEVRENKHTAESEAVWATARAEQATQIRENIRLTQFVKHLITTMRPEAFTSLSNPSSREWGRLGSDGWRQTLASLTARVRLLLEETATVVPSDFDATTARQWQNQTWEETMRQGLLSLKEEEKARRKAEFLGRKQ